MKKFLTVLCMITCIFGLTACSNQKEVIQYDEAGIKATCQTVYENVCMDGSEELVAQLRSMDEVDIADIESLFRQNGAKIEGKALIKGMESYNSATKEIGQRTDIKGFELLPTRNSMTVNMLVSGSLHDAEIEFVFNDKLTITSVTVNPQYSFLEKMERAGLNTLLGMGTVFTVLILISLIIACLGYVPKILEKLSKKEKIAETKAVAVDHTIAQIIKNEEMSDNSELAAVIAAAIAAGEGTTTDGFVVRSIKRAGTNKWQRA